MGWISFILAFIAIFAAFQGEFGIGVVFAILAFAFILGFAGLAGRRTSIDSDFSGIEQQLKKIYKVLGGDLKLKEIEKKEIDDLRERYIRQLVVHNPSLSKKEGREEAVKQLPLDDPNTVQMHRLSIEIWIESSREWVRNKRAYEHLLPKARQYIKSRDWVKTDDVEEALNVNYSGAKWLIEMLESEKKVERVIDYKGDLSAEIKHWKVLA